MLDEEVVEIINKGLEDIGGEWYYYESDDTLQIIVYNYKKDIYINQIQDAKNELCYLTRLTPYFVYCSFIQFDTGNIVFEFRTSLSSTHRVVNKEHCQFN